MSKVRAGNLVTRRELVDIRGERIPIPPAQRLLHLQFRRFAGCPICNLHLRSFVRRAAEVTAAGILEVVVFHSTVDELRQYQDELPFPVIADPDKQLYRDFGVEASSRALLDPRAWQAIVVGVLRSLGRSVRYWRRLPPVNPRHGKFGLPADFLIAPNGRVVAVKYGRHADDQWSVDDLVRLANGE
jgi:peroxiredoxin